MKVLKMAVWACVGIFIWIFLYALTALVEAAPEQGVIRCLARLSGGEAILLIIIYLFILSAWDEALGRVRED